MLNTKSEMPFKIYIFKFLRSLFINLFITENEWFTKVYNRHVTASQVNKICTTDFERISLSLSDAMRPVKQNLKKFP